MRRIKHIELSFQCDEDWNEMLPNTAGRHCLSCEKTVVDFSAISNAQIVAFFSEEKNSKACGRFRNGQLDYLNKDLAAPTKKDRPTLFTPLYFSLLLGLLGCKKSPSSDVTSVTQKEKKELVVAPPILPDSIQTPSQNTAVASRKNETFAPRKFSHVDSVKTPKQLPEVRVDEQRGIVIPQFHLTGIPISTFEEIEASTRFEQFVNKFKLLKNDTQEKKWWHIFRLRNSETNP